ncbi:MAG: O-antigen ligase family protein [Oscillospiraceae bacterium]|nr:O-antigen ligase family protein [Oscillospiraceae bacterium]
MTTVSVKHSSGWGILKEFVICIFIAGVLLTMDRCLENLYFYFLYDTGKRILDLFMALYLHAHRWFTIIIPVSFLLWVCYWRFHVRYGLLLPIGIYYILSLLTSLSGEGFPPRWLNTMLYPMAMILFATIMCSTERGVRRFCRVGCDLYIVLLVLNMAFTLFPQLYHLFTDWEPDYFISADNLTGFPLLFGAMLALLDRHFNHNNVRCAIYLVLFFVNQVLIHCGSALIAGVILAGYLAIPQVKRWAQNKPLSLLIAVSVVLCLLLCGFAIIYCNFIRVEETVDVFLHLIHKESVYVRFIIWNGTAALIARKPLFGYGLGEKAEFFNRPKTTLSYNAHNAYLQTLYEGGLVTTCAALAVLFLTSRFLKKCRDRELSGLFTVLIFAELIMMESSITSWFTWYPVFLIAQIGTLLCSLPREGETT